MVKSVNVLVVLLFGCAYASNFASDWLVDVVIEDIKSDMINHNVSSVKLPDFQKNFTEKFLGIGFNATTSAKNGVLSNLATLQRRSKSTVDQQGNTFTIVSEVGLNDMDVSYEEFDAETWHTSTRGKMSTRCSTDSFALSITASENYFGTCTTVVNFANLTSLGRCSVTVGEGGFFNWLRGYLYTFLLNHYETDITDVINGHIESFAKANIEGINLCKYLKQEHIIKN